jgi:hypothetical protein
VEVEVSCAAISRKIMWLTTSRSVNRVPSSSSTRVSTENRSSPPAARAAGSWPVRNRSSVARPRVARCHLLPATGTRRIAPAAWTQSMNARLIRSSSAGSSIR